MICKFETTNYAPRISKLPWNAKQIIYSNQNKNGRLLGRPNRPMGSRRSEYAYGTTYF